MRATVGKPAKITGLTLCVRRGSWNGSVWKLLEGYGRWATSQQARKVERHDLVHGTEAKRVGRSRAGSAARKTRGERKGMTSGVGASAARGGRGRRVTAGADKRALLVRGTARTQARREALGCGERGASWAERWTVAG